jgi:hypothetical protein
VSDESIFREVDEEVRHEQFKKLWDKFGAYVIAVCIGIVAAVGGIKGWQAYQASQAEAAGGRYLAALDLMREDKNDEAQAIFAEIGEDGPDGYSVLARFQTADALVASGDIAAAIEVIDAIGADGGAEELTRDMATVKSALLNVDTADFASIETRLGSLATEPGPWLHSAREILALAAYKAGDYERADRLYLDIRSDAATPSGIQDRARRMQDLIEPKLRELADQGEGADEGADAGGDAAQ